MKRTISAIAVALAFSASSAIAASDASDASWDTNNDGVISNEEFMAHYDKDGSEFSQWDTDDDGQISKDEYVIGVFSIYDTDESGDMNETEYKIYQDSHENVATRGQLPHPGDKLLRSGK